MLDGISSERLDGFRQNLQLRRGRAGSAPRQPVHQMIGGAAGRWGTFNAHTGQAPRDAM
jgi:hypothetical protein